MKNKRIFNKNNYHYILTLITCFVVYFIITVLLYHTRITHLSTYYGLPGVDTDGTIWYYFARFYTEQHNINFNFTNQLVAYPFGYDVTYIPFFSLIYEFNVLLIKMLGFSWEHILLVGNIVSLISYPLEGLAMFCLIYYFVRNKLIAFISSLIFTFSYFSILLGADFLSLDHLEFIPLYFLSFFYFLDKKTRTGLVLSVFIFAVMFGSNAYWAFFSGIFSVIIFLIYRNEKLPKKIISIIKYYLFLFVVLVLTNLNYIQTQLYNFNHQLLAISGKTDTASEKLISILGFFSPSSFQFLYPWRGQSDFFLGYLALVIGLLGLLTKLRRNRLYMTLFICFLISIVITIRIPGLTFINNIYFFLFPMFRSISRINVLSSLFLASMASLSLKYMYDNYSFFKKNKNIAIILLLISSVYILLEGLNIDPHFYKTTDFQKIDQLYNPVKNNSSIHIIVDYPMNLSDVTSGFPQHYEQLQQVIIQKPQVTGVSPFIEKSINLFPLINDVENKTTIPTLTKYGVDTIIIYNKFIPNDKKVLKALMRDPRLKFLGHFVAPPDNSQYVSGNELARDISVFQIKKVVKENKTRNSSLVKKISGNGTVSFLKPSPYQYNITFSHVNGRVLFLVNEPFTNDWSLYENSRLNKSLFFLFKKQLIGTTHTENFIGLNIWTLNTDTIKKSLPPSSYTQNADGSITFHIIAFYKPYAVSTLENSISIGIYLILIIFLSISLYGYIFNKKNNFITGNG